MMSTLANWAPRKARSTVFWVALLLAWPVSAVADVILVFDGSDAARLMSTRYSNQGIAGQFSVSHEVELTQIGMTLTPADDGNIKFVIFEDDVLIHSSEPVPLAGNGTYEVVSPSFSVLLDPNSTYFIGAIADVEADYGCCGEGGTQGVFTSLGTNSNPSGFYVPELGDLGRTHVDVNLYVGEKD